MNSYAIVWKSLMTYQKSLVLSLFKYKLRSVSEKVYLESKKYDKIKLNSHMKFCDIHNMLIF